MNIIIATSGNGGHLFCGLSIARVLKRRIPDVNPAPACRGWVNMFFLGSGNRLSKRLVEDSGFKFYKVFAAGLSGKTLGLLKFVIGQTINIIQSFFLCLYIRPKVVVSTGGFASIGMVFWSYIFGRPCIIHEQNLIPGKVNRLSAYMARKILISFSGTTDYLRNKRCILTGMPIRFTDKIAKEEARRKLGLNQEKFTILIMGGSHGAHRINQIIVSILEKLPKDMQFIHLTGSQDLNLVRDEYKKNNLFALVEDFSTEMGIVYSASDLVISRAGSGAISEITFFGLPSVLIPYPYSRDRHQYKNAEFLAQKGAAVVMPEEDMSIDNLIELIKSRNEIQEMAQHSSDLAEPLASDKIVDEIVEYLNA